MTIPGADVKKTLIDLLNYIYVDSEIAEVYNSLYGAMPDLFEGKNFSELMQEQIIAPVEAGLPETDMTVTLKVGKGSLIQAAHIELAVPETSEDAEFAIEGLSADYALADDHSESVTINMEAVSGGEPFDVKLEVADAYKDGNYDVDVTCDISSDMSRMSILYDIFADQSGAFNLDFTMAIPDALGAGMDISYNFGGNGSITIDGDQTVYDYPDLHLNLNVLGQEISAGFAAKATTTPISTPYTLSKETTPLFSLGETELAAELQKYTDGFMMLQNTLLQNLLGGSVSAAIPETIPAA